MGAMDGRRLRLLLLSGILSEVAGDFPQCLARLNLDLERDCKWKAKGAPANPIFGNGTVPACFKECFENFDVHTNVHDQILGSPPHDPKRRGSPMCETDEKTAYLCSWFTFKCVKGRESFDSNDFPNSCTSVGSWGRSNKVGAGYAPGGESYIALYAYSNYIGATSVGADTTERVLAARIAFEGIEGPSGVSYDGMCQASFQVQPDSPSECFGVGAGNAALHTGEAAAAPLTPPEVEDIEFQWPVPEHVPSPKPKPVTQPPTTTTTTERLPHHKCLAKLKLDLEMNCKWQANVSSAPSMPTLETGAVPVCFNECFENFEFSTNVHDMILGSPQDRPQERGSPMCNTKSEKTAYLCSWFTFSCLKGSLSFDADAFPNSCSSSSWGRSNKVGAGYAPEGESYIALYAYSMYVDTSPGKNISQRVLAARVMFQGIEGPPGIGYDAICEARFEVEPGNSCFGVGGGPAAIRNNEQVAEPLALPPMEDGKEWPLPKDPSPDRPLQEDSQGSVVPALIAGLVAVGGIAFAAFLLRRRRLVEEDARQLTAA